MVGVEPPEPPLVLVPPPPPLLLVPVPPLLPPDPELFDELEPQAARTSAVIATSSRAANGRTCLFKLSPPPRGMVY